jgi:hypothetical protein
MCKPRAAGLGVMAAVLAAGVLAVRGCGAEPAYRAKRTHERLPASAGDSARMSLPQASPALRACDGAHRGWEGPRPRSGSTD